MYTKIASGKLETLSQLLMAINLSDADNKVIIDGLGFDVDIVEIGESNHNLIIEVRKRAEHS